MTSLTAHRRFLIAWFALTAIFAVNVNILGGKDLKFDHYWQLWHPYYFGLLYATTGIIPAWTYSLRTARLYGGFRSAIGRAIVLLSIGLSSWGVGNFLWYLANTRGTTVPYPSWPDVGYLGILPMSAVALFALRKVIGLNRSDAVKLLWIPLVIALISTYFDTPLLGGKAYLVAEGGGLDKANVVSWIYVGSDTLLMSMALMLLVKSRNAAGGLFFRPVLAIAAGFVSLYVGDTLFFARVFNETFYNGDISDVLYALAMFLPPLGVYYFHSSYVKMYAGLDAAATSSHADGGGADS